MSMHNIPLTELEEEGLKLHGLPISTPSQLADAFRLGMNWAITQSVESKKEETPPLTNTHTC